VLSPLFQHLKKAAVLEISLLLLQVTSNSTPHHYHLI